MEPTLSPEEIGVLLEPYLQSSVEGGSSPENLPGGLLEQISVYLALLLRWNERMNLTSVRDARQIVSRHFGESLFLARLLQGGGSLLDLGSGAGFPGLPIQLWHRGLRVTLAESHGKKAAFLREAVRTLRLPTEVWGDRAERLREGAYDCVVLRAVDEPRRALQTALRLSASGVWMFASAEEVEVPVGVEIVRSVRIPNRGAFLVELRRVLFHVEHVI